MSWLDQLGGLLQQYAGSGQATQTTEQDFDNAANVAPREAMSQGLAEAFRSDQTPPFANMLGQLFANSSGSQRASILNTLIAAAGPRLCLEPCKAAAAWDLSADCSAAAAKFLPRKRRQSRSRTSKNSRERPRSTILRSSTA